MKHLELDAEAFEIVDLVSNEAAPPGFGRARIHVGDDENVHQRMATKSAFWAIAAMTPGYGKPARQGERV